MKFDDIIMKIGEFGPYQKRIFYLVCLSGIPTALQTMSIVFTMGFQKHRCAIPTLSNDTYEVQGQWHSDMIESWIPRDKSQHDCKFYEEGSYHNRTISCSHYVYDTDVFESTIFSEANMVCDDKSLKTYANMIYLGGLLVGSMVLGTLSDMFGRKKLLLFSLLGHFSVSMGTAFVKSYIPFVILRFWTSFFGNGVFLISFVIGMELVGPSKRKYAGIIIELFWTLGLFISSFLGYMIRDWHYLQIATTLPTLCLTSYIFFLPESPRWLIKKGRIEEASQILEKVAAGNRVTLTKPVIQLLQDLDEEQKDESILKIFQSRVLLIRSLIIFVNCCFASMIYYGLSLNVGSLSGDVHLNFTLYAIVEGASYACCLLLLDRLGRKPLQCFSMLVAGLSCIATMFPVLYGNSDTIWITITLSLTGKFGASASYATIYIYAAELFPTPMRSRGMGAASLTAKIGGITAPYIADLGNVISGDMGTVIPLLIFGACTVGAGVLALFLPETTNRILPESVEDAKNFNRTQKIAPMKEQEGKQELKEFIFCSDSAKNGFNDQEIRH